MQLARGEEPTDEEVVPGVLRWSEYQHRRATWDEVRQCIGLDANFYRGAQLLLFPPDALSAAESAFAKLQGVRRQALAIGCDPGEGGANTSWAVVDEKGVVELVSMRTRDTNDIPSFSKQLMLKHGVPGHKFAFDAGGGGKQHADRLRAEGLAVRTVPFGAAVSAEIRRGLHTVQERKDVREEAYVYVNRRVEMYHELSQKVAEGFALPSGSTNGHACPTHSNQCLRAQLAVLPKMTDSESRYVLPPKNKRTEKELCLVDMIGHSPDEGDAIAIAVHIMLHKAMRSVASAG